MGLPKNDYSEGLSGEERFRRLLEAAPDAMVIVNGGGRILLVNSQTESIFGYTREELLNQPVEILIPVSLRQKHSQHRDAYYGAPHVRPMGTGLELLGCPEMAPHFQSKSAQPSGSRRYLGHGTIRDVTERKRARRSLD
jgi:PAS domain-containing protein